MSGGQPVRSKQTPQRLQFSSRQLCWSVSSVGNKNDDPNSKVVETTDAQKFAEQMGINLFETSAKENINVEEVTQTNAPHPHPPVSHREENNTFQAFLYVKLPSTMSVLLA